MLGNWIVMTSSTTGDGDLSLDAVTGYPTIANQFPNSVRFQYVLLADSDGTPIEAGIGYVTSGTTLVRELVTATYVSGTYSEYPSAASLSVTVRVIVTPLSNGVGPSLTQAHASASRFYTLGGYNVSGAATKSITANVLYMIAGPVATTAKITGLACSINTAAGTGSNKIRMGIYSVKADGTPGAVIAETADGLPNSTGDKSLSFGTAIALPAGYYYLGVISDVGPTLKAYSAGSYRGNQTGPLGMNSINNVNGFATDNNGGSTFSGWTTMPTYVGFSFSAFSTDYPPVITLVLA